jgi:NitT/TauT family transport system substrate-binding protein
VCVACVTAGEGADVRTRLSVGFIPIAGYAYFWQAQTEGYFAQEGLDVELVPAAGGAAMIPALESGDLQFGVSDIVALLNAQNGGIDVRFVSLNFYENRASPTHAVITNCPNVQSPKDLKGKVVATNIKYNIDWLLMREWLRLKGVDPETVQFTEIPFPDQAVAVKQCRVAAAGMIEPFYTIAQDQGLRVLGNYFTEVLPVVPTAGVIATQAYISRHPGTVKRFVAAIERAIVDGMRDETVVRRLIREHTPIPPGLVDKVHLQEWRLEADVQGMQFFIDKAHQEDLLKRPLAVADILWKEANRR